MNSYSRLEILYVANASVLIAHEIDSAFWKEWKLFHIPGGIQFFVILHVMLLPVVLLGYREVACRRHYSYHASIALALVGLVAAGVHSALIMAGDTAFTLPVSRMLLLATFILSVIQFYTVRRLVIRNKK